MKKIILIFCTLTILVTLTSCDNYKNTLENEPDNAPENENNPFQSAENENPLLSEETEQILKLLAEYADLYWGMFPLNDLPDGLADESQFVTVERKEGYQTFYKVISGDIRSEAQFKEKLDTLVTENLKKELLENPERPFEFSEGDLYIRSRGAGGSGLGMDKLFLDSIEYPGENEIVVTVTSFGDKNNWGLTEDIRETASATLLKTTGGLHINKCGSDILNFFWFYNEILYGDFSYQIR